MSLSFEIQSAEDFFRKLEEEQRAVHSALTDSRHAINAALTAYHLHEWVWARLLKANPAKCSLLAGEPMRTIKDFRTWALEECPNLEVMRAIANGWKHLSLDGPAESTSLHLGAFDSGFSRGFDVSRLRISLRSGQTRYFDVVLDETVDWWKGVLEKLS